MGGKQNIFVLNLNPVKTGCLLIEVLHAIATDFKQLIMRTQTIRGKIIKLVRAYMVEVNHE
jgi:uncharacterized protein YbbC (DUF1343 family)